MYKEVDDAVGLDNEECYISGNEDVDDVDECVAGTDAVVGSGTLVGCRNAEVVIGGDDFQQTGGKKVCSRNKEIMAHDARIVEVCEDVVDHSNGLENLQKATKTWEEST